MKIRYDISLPRPGGRACLFHKLENSHCSELLVIDPIRKTISGCIGTFSSRFASRRPAVDHLAVLCNQCCASGLTGLELVKKHFVIIHSKLLDIKGCAAS